MDRITNVVERISLVIATISGFVLLSLMVLTVANATFRSMGGVILGTHELSQLIIVVAAAGSFAYATLARRHIVIGIVIDHIAQLPRGILFTVTSAISLFIIAFMVWANVEVISARWFAEYSDVLEIPWLPFRFVFVFGLTFFGLVLLLDIYKGLSGVMKK
jgi:TRAP-type C4-dicarboxylate transport system permease small subunit